MFYREDVEVGLFIGVNCIWVIKLIEVIFGREDDLYVKKIVFGWGVIGVVNLIKNEEDDSYCICYCIVFLEVNFSNGKRMCYFVFKIKVKEIF